MLALENSILSSMLDQKNVIRLGERHYVLATNNIPIIFLLAQPLEINDISDKNKKMPCSIILSLIILLLYMNKK